MWSADGLKSFLHIQPDPAKIKLGCSKTKDALISLAKQFVEDVNISVVSMRKKMSEMFVADGVFKTYLQVKPKILDPSVIEWNPWLGK